MVRIIFFTLAILLGGTFFVSTDAQARTSGKVCRDKPFAGLAANPIDTQRKCENKCKEESASGYTFNNFSATGFDNITNKQFTCCCALQPGSSTPPPRSTPLGSCPPTALKGATVCLDNPFDTSHIPTLIGRVLRMLFGLIGTIALVIFIYGGALWMTAFGEEAKVKRGWDTMIWGAIGLVVIFGSYVAVDFVLKAILGS